MDTYVIKKIIFFNWIAFYLHDNHGWQLKKIVSQGFIRVPNKIYIKLLSSVCYEYLYTCNMLYN